VFRPETDELAHVATIEPELTMEKASGGFELGAPLFRWRRVGGPEHGAYFRRYRLAMNQNGHQRQSHVR